MLPLLCWRCVRDCCATTNRIKCFVCAIYCIAPQRGRLRADVCIDSDAHVHRYSSLILLVGATLFQLMGKPVNELVGNSWLERPPSRPLSQSCVPLRAHRKRAESHITQMAAHRPPKGFRMQIRNYTGAPRWPILPTNGCAHNKRSPQLCRSPT